MRLTDSSANAFRVCASDLCPRRAVESNDADANGGSMSSTTTKAMEYPCSLTVVICNCPSDPLNVNDVRFVSFPSNGER